MIRGSMEARVRESHNRSRPGEGIIAAVMRRSLVVRTALEARTPLRRRRLAAALGLTASLALSSCISSSAAPVGERRYAPLPESLPIPLYELESDVPYEFEVVGKVHACADSGLVSEVRLLERLKKHARELGADALIITQESVITTVQTSDLDSEEDETAELHRRCLYALAIRDRARTDDSAAGEEP